jgi:hypothetical protein
MSEVDAQFVKRGLWTNLDQGAVMGKTITTDTGTGVLVVAILAILSTLGLYLRPVFHSSGNKIVAYAVPSGRSFVESRRILCSSEPHQRWISRWTLQTGAGHLTHFAHLVILDGRIIETLLGMAEQRQTHTRKTSQVLVPLPDVS